MSDAEAERLTRVAGVSREAPRSSYEVAGLSFGEARLERQTRAPWVWSSLVLTLSSVAVKRAVSMGGSDAAVVRMRPRPERVYLIDGWDSERAPDGLCELVAEHGLLSRPEWLWSRGATEIGARETALLDDLRRRYRALTQGESQRWVSAACDGCERARTEADRRARDAEDARYQKLIEGAKTTRDVVRYRQEAESARLRARYAAQTNPREDCPHVALRNEAMGALCRGFPELAFEGLDVLVARMEDPSPRFVLKASLLKIALGPWLMGRAIRAYGWGGFDPWRALARRPRPWVRASLDESMTRTARAALGFSGRAWGFAAEDAFATGAAEGEAARAFALDVVADEPVEGTVILPPGMDAPPPKPPPEKRAKRAKKAAEKP